MKKKKKQYYENTSRSVTKALTFRLLILTSDSIIIYAITRRLDVAISVMIFSNIASTILYFLHERMWNHVHWGKAHIK